MPPLPRRDALRLCSGTLLGTGLSGCLGVGFFDPEVPIGLLVVNHDDQSHAVTVRLTDVDGNHLFEREYEIAADENYLRESIFEGGQFEVNASFVERPQYRIDGVFDFRGCESARVVLTVTEDRLRLGKQDNGC